MEVITDYSTFLREAKEAVLELEQLQSREVELTKQMKLDQKALETAKKQMADAITQTVKKRQSEITSSYDKELSKSQDLIKKAKSKREKAKNQGVKERIAEETSDLRDDNRRIRLQIKTLFQQNHVPGYCNSNLYYALYFPRWFGEVMKLVLTVALCFLAIPYGIYLLLPKQTVLFLVLIYFACILVFGGLYVMIGNKTKDRFAEPLKSGRKLRDQIHNNNKQIRAITKAVKKDKDEARYDLQKFDDELAQLEQQMSEVAGKKKDALNAFETVTKNIITDEITAAHKDKITQLTQACEDEESQLKTLQETLKQRSMHITDCYGSYLSREFLKADKLDALAELIKNGTATNLTEAMQQYKNNLQRPGL